MPDGRQHTEFRRRQTAPDAVRFDGAAREIELSVSSEAPVRRDGIIEVLVHSEAAVDLGAFERSDGLPLLLEHDPVRQIGRVVELRLDTDTRKLLARLRFGESQAALEVLADLRGGIRREVSIGYQINATEGGPGGLVMVTGWTPLEVSIVAIPADRTVGVGRSAHLSNGVSSMSKTTTAASGAAASPASPAAPLHSTRVYETEVREIRALADRYSASGLAERAIRDGMTAVEFRGLLLDSFGGAAIETPAAAHGPSLRPVAADPDFRDFSMTRALRALATNDARAATHEREVSDELGRRLGRSANGLFVPSSVLFTRSTMVAGTDALGGYTVGTDHRPDQFVAPLRAQAMVVALGARVITGLIGDVSIPKQSGSATAQWVTETNGATGSNQSFGSVALSPGTVTANVVYSKQLLVQSSPSIEQIVRDDLKAQIGLAVDLAAIAGSGSGGEPTGILNTAGIGTVALGTDGAAPTWDSVVDLEAAVADNNADLGSLAYLTNSAVRKKLKRTTKVSGDAGAGFVWEDGDVPGMGRLNGYTAAVSNHVPSDLTKGAGTGLSALIFGNWTDLLIGEWGIVDIVVDPYSLATTNKVTVTATMYVDVAVRRAESFGAITDAVTT